MKQFFRSIQSYLTFKPALPTDDVPSPYGLTETEIADLKEMRAMPGWETFLAVLDTRSTLEGEAILAARDPVILHEQRGKILGFRIASGLIDEIANADTLRKETNERRRSNAADERNRVKSATYATAAYQR